MATELKIVTGDMRRTIVLATFFILGGTTELIVAWKLCPRARRIRQQADVNGWGWLALSGALLLLLGIILLLGLPITAIWAIGVLIGLALIFLGGSRNCTRNGDRFSPKSVKCKI